MPVPGAHTLWLVRGLGSLTDIRIASLSTWRATATRPIASMRHAINDGELLNRRYLLITSGMRRKPGALVPLEQSIVVAASELMARGQTDFHGYAIAKLVRDGSDARRLTGHGTMYRALDRLEAAGLLTSDWEEAEAAAAEGRPRRRLYQLTASGEAAADTARRERPAAQPSLRPRSAQL